MNFLFVDFASIFVFPFWKDRESDELRMARDVEMMKTKLQGAKDIDWNGPGRHCIEAWDDDDKYISDGVVGSGIDGQEGAFTDMAWHGMAWHVDAVPAGPGREPRGKESVIGGRTDKT